MHDGIMTVAMSDPTSVDTLDALRYMLGHDVDAVIADESQIEKVIKMHYSTLGESVGGIIGDIQSEVEHIQASGSMIGESEIIEELAANYDIINIESNKRASDYRIDNIKIQNPNKAGEYLRSNFDEFDLNMGNEYYQK